MNSCSITNGIIKIEKIYKKIEDNVLDEYNKGTISKKEMVNIITWCEKMKKQQTEELESQNEQ